MSRTLIAYYSRTGTAKRVADQLQQLTQWPQLELQDVQSRAGFVGDLRCMSESLLFRTPAYHAVGPDPAGFDHMVVISPIWMGQLASPVRSFLYDIFGPRKTPTIQRVSLVCVMGLQGGFNAAAEIARIIGRPPLPVLALRQADVLDGSSVSDLYGLRDAIQGMEKVPDAARPNWLSPEAS